MPNEVLLSVDNTRQAISSGLRDSVATEHSCTDRGSRANSVAPKERALLMMEDRYRLLFERNVAGVFISTLDGRILDCNPAFARILGYGSPAEILARRAIDFYFSPSDREEFLSQLGTRQVLTNYEICYKRKDGAPAWVLENVSLVSSEDDQKQIIEGTVDDFSHRISLHSLLG